MSDALERAKALLADEPTYTEPILVPQEVLRALVERLEAAEKCAEDLERRALGSRVAGAREAQSPTWPYVLAFAREMEKKLAANRHKGDREGWINDTAVSLLRRLRQETAELADTLRRRREWNDGGSAAVAGEAADVANFAMMIADVCGALILPPGDADGTCAK